ncbi:neugrin [Amyelois transitella]|uniref:neugrin n=1 Tax=Amyelois transitella TaxID=680683 RepID=UPI0029905DD6|nr:neugrin [Amyelois transitella]
MMFVIKLRPFYKICDKVMIRNLRSSRLGKNGANPGLDKRLNAFRQEGLRMEDDDAEEFIEQSELDVYNVGEAYNEHMNETLIGKYELRHQIIKEKYFKENMPNLLTWSEKEQIRHLATTEPDEWTPERIAESFPVTVPVVKKLLKYPWKPATEQRIARHDASVMRNWKELKEGTFDIPKDIRQHFLKFSDRKIPPLNKKSIKIEVKQHEKYGEFESIVRRCAAQEQSKNNKNLDQTVQVGSADSQENKSKTSTSARKELKRVTLDELTERIKKRMDQGSDINLPDKIILETVNSNQTLTSSVSNNEIELFNEESQNNQVSEYIVKKDDPSAIMEYPERIRIPKKAYKKGATYKVNDCFYDHDGKFLYRVLGM